MLQRQQSPDAACSPGRRGRGPGPSARLAWPPGCKWRSILYNGEVIEELRAKAGLGGQGQRSGGRVDDLDIPEVSSPGRPARAGRCQSRGSVVVCGPRQRLWQALNPGRQHGVSLAATRAAHIPQSWGSRRLEPGVLQRDPGQVDARPDVELAERRAQMERDRVRADEQAIGYPLIGRAFGHQVGRALLDVGEAGPAPAASARPASAGAAPRAVAAVGGCALRPGAPLACGTPRRLLQAADRRAVPARYGQQHALAVHRARAGPRVPKLGGRVLQKGPARCLRRPARPGPVTARWPDRSTTPTCALAGRPARRPGSPAPPAGRGAPPGPGAPPGVSSSAR